MWELLAGNRKPALPRHARRRRIRSYPDLCASKFNITKLKAKDAHTSNILPPFTNIMNCYLPAIHIKYELTYRPPSSY